MGDLLTKLAKALPSLATTGLVALLNLAPLPAAAQETVEFPPKKEQVKANFYSKLKGEFVGRKQRSLATIFNYQDDTGVQVAAEVSDCNIHRGKGYCKDTDLSLGLRVPILGKGFRFNAALDHYEFKKGGYTMFFDGKLVEELTLRSGAIIEFPKFATSVAPKVGGFIGMTYHDKEITVDFDAWIDGHGKQDSQGYVAGIIPVEGKHFYLSLGGRFGKKSVNLVGGLINQGGLGIFLENHWEENNNYGKIVFVPDGSTYNRGAFDFFSHILNGTEMRNVVSGYILDSWPFLDGFAVEEGESSFAVIGKWHGNHESEGASAELIYRPYKNVFVGIGAGNSVDQEDKHNPALLFEAYLALPKLPLGVSFDYEQNLRTGKTKVTINMGLDYFDVTL